MLARGLLVVALAWLVYCDHIIGPLEQEPLTVGQPAVCHAIASTISSESDVFYPGSDQYYKGIEHWAASSAKNCTCTVEPGTAEDVGKIIQILAKYRTPFSVKGGGHALNPGHSSTDGVLICMYRFRDVKYDPSSETVVLGTGLKFGEVYAALEPYDISVVGARAVGVGVAGFTLGAGYSWKSNEFGLAFDTVIAYELVKPNGEVFTVTKETDPELFFGLKGGFKNFGIVTRVTMKAYPQGLVWGGLIVYPEPSFSDVNEAVAKFSDSNTDPKANIAAAYDCKKGQNVVAIMLFYDDPNPPTSLFEDFLSIPSLLSTVKATTLTTLIRDTTDRYLSGARGIFNTVPLASHTLNVVRVIESEVHHWCNSFPEDADFWISYVLEPFIPSVLSHNTTPTAYPPFRDRIYFPLDLYMSWTPEELDSEIISSLKESSTRIRNAAIEDGQEIENAPMYPNYALYDTPLEKMYGDNVDKLKELRKRVDPSNVMGLTGGFIF